jgi:hypothetical protein
MGLYVSSPESKLPNKIIITSMVCCKNQRINEGLSR